MNVQLKKLPQIIKKMNDNKYYIKANLGDISPIMFREVIDEKGDSGYSLILIFKTIEHIELFYKIVKANYKYNLMRVYRINETNYHIYYNCTNLVQKMEALPGGFPWNLVESDKYHYHKGTLPITDDILDRAIGIRLPVNINYLQKVTFTKCLKNLIAEFKKSLDQSQKIEV